MLCWPNSSKTELIIFWKYRIGNTTKTTHQNKNKTAPKIVGRKRFGQRRPQPRGGYGSYPLTSEPLESVLGLVLRQTERSVIIVPWYGPPIGGDMFGGFTPAEHCIKKHISPMWTIFSLLRKVFFGWVAVPVKWFRKPTKSQRKATGPKPRALCWSTRSHQWCGGTGTRGGEANAAWARHDRH